MNNAIINYALNKFIPYICLFLFIFSQMDYATIYPYVTIGFIVFVDKFSFKTGYSVAYCEKNNIDLDVS
jgi:hypothetical protein